jgi:tetratricopeptide (TPR) repeat protein
LPPDEKALLHDAAVIGEVFWVGAAAAIGGRTRMGYEPPLEGLVREDLVRRADRSAMEDEAQYVFKHSLIRDVAYTQIPRVERSLKHVRAAEWITAHARADDVAELTAHHYVSALELAQSAHFDAEDVGERAVEALWRAGERARQLYANDDAAAYLRRALELLDKGVGADADRQAEVALGVHESLGDVLQRTGQHADGEAAFAAAFAIAQAEDRVRRGRLLRKQGLSQQLRRRIDDALATYAAADKVLGDEPAGRAWWEERCEIAILRLQLLYFGRSLDEFAEESERVRPLVVAHGTAAQRSSLLHWLGVVILRRDRFVASEEVLELERAAVAAALEADNAGAMPFVRFSYGLCLLWASQLDEAETEMRGALALAERVGEATVAVRCINYLALVARRRADIDVARELATRTLEAAERIDMLEYVVQARANLVWVAWRAGDLAVAEREARELASGWDDILIMSAFKWMTAWPLLGVALERGDVSEAVEHARTIIDPDRQAMPPEPEARLTAAVAAWDSGDTDHARTHLDAAAALAARDGYL